MDKWIITRVETDEPIETYKGTFMDVMKYLNRYYQDGDVDVESYENWLNRKRKERQYDKKRI